MGPLESLGHRELDAAIPSSIRDSGAELQSQQLGVRPPIWVSFFIINIFLILPKETFTSL